MTDSKPRASLYDRLKKGLEEGIEHEQGLITLHSVDLVVPDAPKHYTAEDVKNIRTRLRMSQAGFARLLHISCKTVQSWEQGVRSPQHSSARLLQFVEYPELLTSISQLNISV